MISTINSMAQNTLIPLWPNDRIPNRIESNEKEVQEVNGIIRISKVQEPSIEVFLPSKSNATGKAMLIFPGGWLSHLGL